MVTLLTNQIGRIAQTGIQKLPLMTRKAQKK